MGTGANAGIHTDFLVLSPLNWCFIIIGVTFLVVPILLGVVESLVHAKGLETAGIAIFAGALLGIPMILFGWLCPVYGNKEKDWQRAMTTMLETTPEQDATIFIDTYPLRNGRATPDRVTSIEADGTFQTYTLACMDHAFKNLPRKQKLPVKVVRYETGKDALFIGDTFRLWCKANPDIGLPDELTVHHYNKY